MAVWIAVELPEEVADRILKLVQTGRYPSISSLIQEALRSYLELGETIEKYLEQRLTLVEEGRGRAQNSSRRTEEKGSTSKGLQPPCNPHKVS